MALNSCWRFSLCEETANSKQTQERFEIFDARFSRCEGLLYFLAFRVLGGEEGMGDAVRNCRQTASRRRPIFQYEGDFRSWLFRILIDEALAVLSEMKNRAVAVR